MTLADKIVYVKFVGNFICIRGYMGQGSSRYLLNKTSIWADDIKYELR